MDSKILLAITCILAQSLCTAETATDTDTNKNESELSYISQDDGGLEKMNMRVFRTAENGAKLELYDGSVWAIFPPDALEVALWDRGDVIEEKSTNGDSPAWELWNATQEQQAGADLIQAASPTGVRAPDPASYFAGANLVTAITNQCADVALDDGNAWEVFSPERFLIKKWQPGQRVRVSTNTYDVLFSNTLSNLDNGISVHVRNLNN